MLTANCGYEDYPDYCPFFDNITHYGQDEYMVWVLGDDEVRKDIELRWEQEDLVLEAYQEAAEKGYW